MGSINKVEPVEDWSWIIPLYLAAVFGFDRETVTVATHGDDGILQIGAQGSVDQTVQSGVDHGHS